MVVVQRERENTEREERESGRGDPGDVSGCTLFTQEGIQEWKREKREQ